MRRMWHFPAYNGEVFGAPDRCAQLTCKADVHLVFRNSKEFHEWKAEEESSQNCWVILPTGSEKLASGGTRIHYHCNRSGEARKKEGHSDRREKSQGSCRSDLVL
ncbi:uncharacterized protein LOC142589062 isoform X2 [Dermacentor variabilis]|uniref:uncharacterized protein LOC142575128 isoform X2 n=1 Tax=Dermacentor variabilis TaxID=34621 RepID=UPI003F5B183C